MEDKGGTASLRTAAPHWTLAGDKQLLNVLQGIHERIVSKCQETNSSLEHMVRTLDTASINLQNVNNRFMALSNSQFVESRVYDDDVDTATDEAPVKEPPKPADPSDLTKLKESLNILESYHEGVTILDSDSDSGSDEEDRMVFKPKDLYAERPLPYIIGSQQWRSKWHAGLIPEDSDSDSSTSKRDQPPSEQYSESEPEGTDDLPPEKPHVSQRTISTPSSLGSELTIPTVGKPADIAAELARRLGGNIPPAPAPEPESPAPVSAPTKVYRPQQPTTATIFPDEPPPLDQYQSDVSSDEDIFAELHRSKPSRQTDTQYSRVVDELFGDQPRGDGDGDSRDVFGGWDVQPTPVAKQSSPLFKEPQEPELFVEKVQSKPQAPSTEKQPNTNANVKKPIGGISLFGNNKGTESIGAAILKRNQRRDSTDEDSDDERPEVATKAIDSVDKAPIKVNEAFKPEIKTVGDSNAGRIEKSEKEIINDLFTKPKVEAKKKGTNVTGTKKEKVESKGVKVDLFSDNLFDDIDDIFTSNVKKTGIDQKSSKKSLFDDDDDDLFANVAVPSKSRSQDMPRSQEKPKPEGLFDSDDDLFSEKPKTTKIDSVKTSEVSKSANVVSNNELFSNKNDIKEPVKSSEVIKPKNIVNESRPALNDNGVRSEGSINKVNESIIAQETKSQNVQTSTKSKVKSIFDSDSDDDIFADFKASKFMANDKKVEGNNHETVVARDTENKRDTVENRPRGMPKLDALDDFENEDSLFVNNDKQSISKEQSQGPENKINESHKNDVKVDEFDDDYLYKNGKKTDTVLAEPKEVIKDVKNNIIKDDTDDDLFSTNFTKNNKFETEKAVSNILTDDRTIKPQTFRSPSLFGDDDDIDDIFSKNAEEISPKDSFKEVEVKNSNVTRESEEEEQFDKNTDKTQSNEDILQANVSTSNNISSIINDNNSSDIKDIKSNEPKVDESTVQNIINNEFTEQSTIVNQDLEDENKIKSNLEPGSRIPDLPKEDLYENNFDSIHPEIENEDQIIEPSDDFTQNEPLFFKPKEPVSTEPDIFSDIFNDVPPEFEKPKEPKKSRNINALFDDDSDDEALFFKGNDTVTDEKPDISFGTQERLFHIFHDEPPAIDVDFTQKYSDSPENITRDSTQPTNSFIDNIDHIPHVNTQLGADNSRIDNEVTKINTESTKIETIEPETKEVIDEVKKPVGKLKPMNLNINVTSLLPGASPKKTKSYEQTDGQIITKNLDDLSPKEEEDPKMVKSVSFEGDPDNGVLDNKLSKERAKIQVKRRPSTRRARREAVRKSGIDFGDDSTDNSSSLDLPKSTDVAVDEVDNKVVEKDNKVMDNDLNSVPKIDSLERQDNVAAKTSRSDSNASEKSSTVSDVNEEREEKKIDSVTTGFNTRTNVKSKVVYILNDEDIFTNTTPELQNKVSKSEPLKERKKPEKVNKNKVLNIVDDDDDLFRTTKDVPNIGTLGNSYKDVKHKEMDRFDSDEDIFKASQTKTRNNDIIRVEGVKSEIDNMEAKIDELFVKTTKNQSSKAKTSVFDLSDDDDELFGSKSTKKANVFDNDRVFSGPSNASEKKKDLKLPVVKGSLFGDDSDDDLFGGKSTRNQEPIQTQPKSKEVAPKASQPVFEDPLSMQGDEDDL